jgi:SAM-dependent methyltransferase
MRLPIRTFDGFRDAFFEYRLPRIILTALELRLFTAMGTKNWSMPELVRKTRLSERGLTILCRNLAMAGLLVKKGVRYRNSRLAATLLNADNPSYRGHYLSLMMEQWTDWGKLTGSVRTGKPVDHNEPEDPEYRRRFTWAMHHRSLETAPQIAAQVPLRGVRTLLDLGGGPGTYAMAFLSRNPALRATVCDRPAALEVVKKIALSHSAGSRLSYLPLDLLTEPIPGPFDVIWYSNVLHIYSPEQNRSVFERARRALNPGGRLIIQDAFLHDREGLFPAEASLFAVTMLLFTDSGNTYSVSDTAKWLKAAGFGSIKVRKTKKGSEDWEGGILEATVAATTARTNGHRRRSVKGSGGR